MRKSNEKLKQMIEGFTYILLAGSAMFSATAYEHLLFPGAEYGLWYGLLVSILISILLGVISNEVFECYFDKNTSRFHYFTPLLLFLVIGNAVADYNGAPNLAKYLHESDPANTLSPEIQSKIDAVTKKQQDILDFYGYCRPHKSKHIKDGKRDCKSLVVPTSVSGIIGSSKHGYDQEGDRETYKALEDEKALYVAELKEANGKFKTSETEHKERVSRSQGTLRGISALLTIIYIYLLVWIIREREANGTAPVPNAIHHQTNGTAPVPNAIHHQTNGTAPVPNAIHHQANGTAPVPNAIHHQANGTAPVPSQAVVLPNGSIQYQNGHSGGKINGQP